MTKSREELVRAALAIVHGDGGSGQNPEAEDTEFVNSCVDPVLDELAELDIYPYCDPDKIENSAFLRLALCLANAPVVRDRYGKAEDVVALANAHRILRTITAATLSYQPARGEYF